MKSVPVFLLLLCALATGNEAFAQIIYTDIVPDTTIMPPVNSGYSIRLDLNRDGTTDFTMGADNFGETYDKVNIAGTEGSDQIAGDGSVDKASNFFPLAFRTGDLIGEGSGILWTNFWDTTFGHGLPSTLAGYGLSGQGHWITKLTGFYLGVRKRVRNNWVYGWIGLDVSPQANAFTLRDYAINTMPNEPIRAGSTTTGIDRTPSPGSIALHAYADVLRIQLGNGVASATVMVHDAMGRRVRSLVVEAPGASVSLRDLPRGLYFSTAYTGKESIVRKVAVW
ncbi:MAG: T9SS type A sorting domain-containing protein [Ignavibacteria bacterium]|nr:T9SS type A sorting domain-containing protein [Ignavibacteria bacterium]